MTSNTFYISITLVFSITTLTQKGQLTIPRVMRNKLGLEPRKRVRVEMGKGHLKVKPIEDLLDIAGMYKAPKGKNALQAREYMELHYKRG